MHARTTDQGTAASETALCSPHATPTNRGIYGIAADTDVTGPWVEVFDNDELRCQVCGASSDPLDGVAPHIPGTDYHDGRDGSIEAEDDDEDRIADAAREEMHELVEWQRSLTDW